MKVKLYAKHDREAWDLFIESSKNAHFMFRRDYMEYHSDRYVDFSLMVMNGANVLVAILPANLSDRTLYSHQGLTFGGISVHKKATTLEVYEIFRSIIQFLADTQLVDRFIYKRLPDIYASYPSQEDLYALFRFNASLTRRDLNVVIDMQNPLPLSKMRIRRFKKAQKRGVIISEITELETFWLMLDEVLTNQHKVKPVHSIAEIQSLRDQFPNHIKCYVAEMEGQIIAGTVVYETAHLAHTQYLASSTLGREVGALDLVLHTLIDEVFSEKRYFSFGISTEESGSVLNEGLLAQKEGFGARAVVHDFYELEIKS